MAIVKYKKTGITKVDIMLEEYANKFSDDVYKDVKIVFNIVRNGIDIYWNETYYASPLDMVKGINALTRRRSQFHCFNTNMVYL